MRNTCQLSLAHVILDVAASTLRLLHEQASVLLSMRGYIGGLNSGLMCAQATD
jgi:hypothetical protein